VGSSTVTVPPDLAPATAGSGPMESAAVPMATACLTTGPVVVGAPPAPAPSEPWQAEVVTRAPAATAAAMRWMVRLFMGRVLG